MALSNSTNYTQTAQDIIRMAFFHIGKYGNGRTIASDDYFIASNLLNAMIKEWQGMGLHLWAKQEGLLFVTPYQAEYDLGSYTYFTKTEDAVVNQLSTALVAGDTAVNVVTTSGIAVNDKIGIVLDIGSTFWTTVQSITDSTNLVLNSAVTSAAALSNFVYSFTTTADKPLRISSARLIQGFDQDANGTSQVELPMSALAYQDYWNMSAVTLSGQIPNQFHYNPQVSTGTLYLWPKPSTSAVRVQISYERLLEDMDSLNNTFDFPAEWFSALQYQLAVRLAPGYGKEEKLTALMPIASNLLQNIKDWDIETTSIRFMPDYTSGYHD